MENPQAREGNLEGSQGSAPEPPLQDISRELQKIKMPEFTGGRPGRRGEAWLEGMICYFSLHEYTSSSKARMAIFQPKDDALNWWSDLERNLHITPLTI